MAAEAIIRHEGGRTPVSYPARNTSGTGAVGLSWQRVFPGKAEQVAALRRWITSLLPDCPSRGDLALVASELAGNAIRHTASGQGGTFAVQVTWGGDTVVVAVDDAGGPGEPRVVDNPLSEGGRGLLVVRELSARMSVSGTDRGRQVCAEIPWQDPAEAATGQAYLGRRFGVTAWYGSCTRQWWALAGSELLSAPSVPELAVLLTRSGLAVLAVYAIAGWNPMTDLFFWLGTVGGFGVLLLLAATSAAVIAFFARDHRGQGSWARPPVPALALLALGATVTHYAALLGTLPGGPATWALRASCAVMAAAAWGSLPPTRRVSGGIAGVRMCSFLSASAPSCPRAGWTSSALRVRPEGPADAAQL